MNKFCERSKELPIKWNASEDADSYVIKIQSKNENHIYDTNENTYLIPNLAPDTTYEITVSAKNKSGIGSDCKPIQLKTGKNRRWNIVRLLIYILDVSKPEIKDVKVLKLPPRIEVTSIGGCGRISSYKISVMQENTEKEFKIIQQPEEGEQYINTFSNIEENTIYYINIRATYDSGETSTTSSLGVLTCKYPLIVKELFVTELK